MGRVEARRPVLFVDDDEDDRAMVAHAFGRLGRDEPFETLPDGDSLMRRLNGDGMLPALILLDLNMPGKSGLECLEEIRADARLSPIVVVILSTSDAARDVSAAYDGGANAYVTKPMRLAELRRCIETLATFWLDCVRPPPR